MCVQKTAKSRSFYVDFLEILDKVCLCVRYAYTQIQNPLCGGTQLTSSSWSGNIIFWKRKCKRMKNLQPVWDWDGKWLLLCVCVCVSLPLWGYCGGGRRLVCVSAGWPVRALWRCRLSRMLSANSLTSLCVCGCELTCSSCWRPPSSNNMLQ